MKAKPVINNIQPNTLKARMQRVVPGNPPRCAEATARQLPAATVTGRSSRSW